MGSTYCPRHSEPHEHFFVRILQEKIQKRRVFIRPVITINHRTHTRPTSRRIHTRRYNRNPTGQNTYPHRHIAPHRKIAPHLHTHHINTHLPEPQTHTHTTTTDTHTFPHTHTHTYILTIHTYTHRHNQGDNASTVTR